MKVFPQRSVPGLCIYRGRPQIRDRVGGEAGGETPSGAGRDGVASTGSRGRAPPEPGAEAEVFSLTTVGGSTGGGGGGEGGGVGGGGG